MYAHVSYMVFCSSCMIIQEWLQWSLNLLVTIMAVTVVCLTAAQEIPNLIPAMSSVYISHKNQDNTQARALTAYPCCSAYINMAFYVCGMVK